MKLYVWGILAVIVLGASFKYLNERVNTLTTELAAAQEANKKIAKDIKDLQVLQSKRDNNSVKQEKQSTKLRKDATREKTVVAKPKLVEKMVNESFNKMAAELSESTK